MLPRILIAAAALGVLGTPAEPMHYKIEVKSGQQMDMSSLGQGMMNINITATSWVTIATRDSAGRQLLHIVVDSSLVDAPDMPGGVDASAMMKVANGTALDLSVVEGKLQGIDPETMTSSPGMGFVIAGIGLLYPPEMRKGMKVGDSWTDTIKTDTTTAMGKGTSTQVRKWKASAREGDATVFDNEFTGTMTIGGGMANVDAVSSGTSHMVVAPKGPARSASTQSKTDMTMTIPGAPTPIQMIVTGGVTITPIK
jgi:hypothetical protein